MKFKLTSDQIKLIAIVAMVIDHIGSVGYPELPFLRIIGRLTLPIMCYFIAIGYEKTHAFSGYLGRLLFWGVVSILPYSLYFKGDYHNVLFTLALGLVLLRVLDTPISSDLKFLAIIGTGFISTAFHFDGSFVAIGFILIFRYFRDFPTKKWSFSIALLICYQLLILYISPSWNHVLLYVQNASLLAFPLLSHYDGNRGRLKYLFYMFYPFHLLILYYLLT